jgi:sulfatase modifying factor 1
MLDFAGLTGGPTRETGPCPGRGAVGVRVAVASGFCIDSTEVSRAEYAEFIAEREGDSSGQPSGCSWNDSYLPSASWPPGAGELALPVVAVDWCDAAAYCLWAGKALCGRIGGGALAPTAMNDPTASMWYTACSRAGERAYPYGTSFQSTACIGGGLLGPAAVGSTASCEGGYEGIFDLSGNIEEWIDSCDATSAGAAAAQDSCLSLGGNYSDGATLLSCVGVSDQMQFRKTREAWRGFRCCSP